MCSSLAVVHQPSVTIHGLFVSKSRISKKNLNIPRLELVSASMASNLIENAKAALKRSNIRSVTGWTDSTLVLHCLNRQGLYIKYIVHKVPKVALCPNQKHPEDIGSRGSLLIKIPDIWWKGPT